MPKTAKIRLNEVEYTITERRSRENAAWRARLEEPFKELADLLETAPDVEITNMQSLASLVRSVSGMLLHSIDTVKALLVDYAPELANVMDDAYDSEILDAFTEVLSLAYPFGSLIKRLADLGSGATRT